MTTVDDINEEKFKENILLPYELDVLEALEDMEDQIRKDYSGQKHSLDMKSLDPTKDIEIKIKIKYDYKDGSPEFEADSYKNIVNMVKKYCKAITDEHLASRELQLKVRILLLIFARILRYDKNDLWVQIKQLVCGKFDSPKNAKNAKRDTQKDGEKKSPDSIEQPFYELKFYKTKKNEGEIGLVIKDHIALPKDFTAAYFGYDTGIEGLNLLFNGGFLLPPDRSSYVSVSGEAGIGKTALVVKLITAFFQNYGFKNVYHRNESESKSLDSKNSEQLYLKYILLEQRKENIIRLIKACELIDKNNSNIEAIIGKKEPAYSLTAKDIEAIVDFDKSESFSPMSLIEKIEEIEKGEKKPSPNGNRIRNVIVIDSVNAIQEIDITRTEWRELFQSIKAITQKRNTIVFFIVEKDPDQPDFIVEYMSDVVIKLHKEYRKETFYRVIELVESRFQNLFHGKHMLYITKPNSGFIRIYPSSTAMGELIPHRKRVQPAKIDIYENKKEVGIKIDGIVNFFKYSHLYSTKMEPFFLKNSISMFSGDRGSHKSAFAKKFALSGFRDERWETSTEYIIEFDYREQEANKPWEELFSIGFWNARPVEKSIPLLLYFSENYDEDPQYDIIWETYLGKIVIPGCAGKRIEKIGEIPYIVCSYEVKDLPEDIYLFQVEELIRTIESFKCTDAIPQDYYEFINRKSLSLLNRRKNDEEYSQKPNEDNDNKVKFNPYNIIYGKSYNKNYTPDLDKFIEREIHIMGFHKTDITLEKIIALIEAEEKSGWSCNGIRLEKAFQPLLDLKSFLHPNWTNLLQDVEKSIKKLKKEINKKKQDEAACFSTLPTFFEQQEENLIKKIQEKQINGQIINRWKKYRQECLNILENKKTKLDEKIKKIFKALDRYWLIFFKLPNSAINRCLEDYLEKMRTIKNNNQPIEQHKRQEMIDSLNNLELLFHKIDFIRRIFIFKECFNFAGKAFNVDLIALLKEFRGETGKPVKSFFNTELLNSLREKEAREEHDNVPREGNRNDRTPFYEEAFQYDKIRKIKVSRMILDDAENLENVYTSLNPQKYVSTLAHLCLAREITLGIVNTRSKNETSEVDTVCSAVSDNAFKFEKYFLKGELFTTFSIIRSATSFHNNMLYFINKRDDGLLQLNNTFALLAQVEKQTPEPIELRLFLPDLSKEFSKSMYRIVINRDIFLKNLKNRQTPDESKADKKPIDINLRKITEYTNHVKINCDNDLEISYNFQEKFPSIYKEWHEFLKEMITYSLAHPKVNVFTANDPFTDISIILEDESAKDAITILCLPGYLMDLYERNLASITDYVRFPGDCDNIAAKVRTIEENKWLEFPKNLEECQNKEFSTKFGNDFYYLHKSALKILPPKEDPEKNNSEQNWIIPEIIFNPAIARDEKTNRIIIKQYYNDKYLQIKGYPYYIDPRVNLVISTSPIDEGKLPKSSEFEDITLDYFIHNNAHDFVTFFFELWFYKSLPNLDECGWDPDNRSCKAQCNFCFFERVGEEKANNPDFLEDVVIRYTDFVINSVQFNRKGLSQNMYDLAANETDKKTIILREWYSSAQQKLKVLEPLLDNYKKPIYIKLLTPKYFLYTTWYLAIPVNSPRKETASEIIIKMTEPHDLAHHQVSGIGLPLNQRIYDKNMRKFYPEYCYSDTLEAMKNLIYNRGKSFEGKFGIPVSSIHCYFEQLTLLGGILADYYRFFRNSLLVGKKKFNEIDRENHEEKLVDKLINFGKRYKTWQRDEKNRCDSCFMTYLLCKRTHPDNIQKKNPEKHDL